MLAVAIGGFFGAIFRFIISQFIHVQLQKAPFIATGLINAIGSFLLGAVIGSLHSDFVLHFMAIGFLGAFTTFSTFSFEVVQLFEQKKERTALCYIVSSTIISISFAAIGYLL